MGNVSSRKTNKLQLLNQEINDFSFTVANDIMQQAVQDITVVQTQDVTINIREMQNCGIVITQSADIFAKQHAEFTAVLTNPRELLKYYVTSPNSIYNQALRSSSEITKQFFEAAEKAFNIPSDKKDVRLRNKITNILKTNLTSKAVQSCLQNIFVVQNQNVELMGELCKDTNIIISQRLLLEAGQSCILEIFENSLLKDPTFRRALREFNGDYDRGLLDENLDAGAKIPPACFLDQEPDIRVRDCPPCEQCIIPTTTYIPSDFQTVVFRAWFVYGSLIVFLLIMIILAVIKIRNNKMK
jgi:hypothetical protein